MTCRGVREKDDAVQLENDAPDMADKATDITKHHKSVDLDDCITQCLVTSTEQHG